MMFESMNNVLTFPIGFKNWREKVETREEHYSKTLPHFLFLVLHCEEEIQR